MTTVAKLGPGLWRVSGVASSSMSRARVFGVLGGVHGNERTGIELVETLLGEAERGELELPHGLDLILGFGNPDACKANVRFVDQDLNRCFSAKLLASDKSSVELERARFLAPHLRSMSFLLDVHSTNAPSEPFVRLSGPVDSSISDGEKKNYNYKFKRLFLASCLSLLSKDPLHLLLDPFYKLGGNVCTTDDFVTQAGGLSVCLETGLAQDVSNKGLVYTALKAMLKVAVADFAHGVSPRDLPKELLNQFQFFLPLLPHVFRPFKMLGPLGNYRSDLQWQRPFGEANWQPTREGDILLASPNGQDFISSPANGVIVFPKIPSQLHVGQPVGWLAQAITVPKVTIIDPTEFATAVSNFRLRTSAADSSSSTTTAASSSSSSSPSSSTSTIPNEGSPGNPLLPFASSEPVLHARLDFYARLQISPGAIPDEIKAAYRRKAMQHHPDQGGDEIKFRLIQEAYDTLSDSVKRAVYNASLELSSGTAQEEAAAGKKQDVYVEQCHWHNESFVAYLFSIPAYDLRAVKAKIFNPDTQQHLLSRNSKAVFRVVKGGTHVERLGKQPTWDFNRRPNRTENKSSLDQLPWGELMESYYRSVLALNRRPSKMLTSTVVFMRGKREHVLLYPTLHADVSQWKIMAHPPFHSPWIQLDDRYSLRVESPNRARLTHETNAELRSELFETFGEAVVEVQMQDESITLVCLRGLNKDHVGATYFSFIDSLKPLLLQGVPIKQIFPVYDDRGRLVQARGLSKKLELPPAAAAASATEM